MIARYISPTVATTGAIVVSVGGADTGATGSLARSWGALEGAPSAVPAGDKMVALGGDTAEIELSAIGALTGNKPAPIGPIVGERLGVPEGESEGLSEGCNERY